MDAAPDNANKYLIELERSVSIAKDHLAHVRQRYDFITDNRLLHGDEHPMDQALDAAKASLKHAQERLQRWKSLPIAALEAELAALEASTTPERIAEALAPARAKLLQSALLRVEAKAETILLEQNFRDRARRASEIRATLRQREPEYVDVRKLAGFAEFNGRDVAPGEVLAALDAMARQPDDGSSSLRASLTIVDGRLHIAAVPARDLLRFAGIG